MALTHGGDTEGFLLVHGYEPLDFSANVNPLGTPDTVAQAIREAAGKLDAYPDPLCRRLTHAIAKHEGLSEKLVLCGNGAADLIWRLALAVKPRCALITSPTFSEYELALSAVSCDVRRYLLDIRDSFALTEDFLKALTPDIDMVFLCNPNNPTGLTIALGLLRAISDACKERNILLVVDECFNGFVEQPEAHTLRNRLACGDRHILILKAFTKLYGMAGARLGYCMCVDEALLEKIRLAGQPWAVSSLAQAAGIAALQAQDYVNETKRLIRAEREYLRSALLSLGLTMVSGEANYLFFHADIPALTSQMASRGILIRDCSNYPGLQAGYYRIAVRTHTENGRLIGAMQACIKEVSWQNR